MRLPSEKLGPLNASGTGAPIMRRCYVEPALPSLPKSLRSCCEPPVERLRRFLAHVLGLLARERDPAAQQIIRARLIIIFDQANAVLLDFAPDIHLIGN